MGANGQPSEAVKLGWQLRGVDARVLFRQGQDNCGGQPQGAEQRCSIQRGLQSNPGSKIEDALNRHCGAGRSIPEVDVMWQLALCGCDANQYFGIDITALHSRNCNGGTKPSKKTSPSSAVVSVALTFSHSS